MFRRLYWVSELIHADGSSKVAGVYTSIPDLVRHGVSLRDHAVALRLTLTKLDAENGALGTWTSPNFDGLEERLQEFVRTEEFSTDQVQSLLGALHALAPLRAAG